MKKNNMKELVNLTWTGKNTDNVFEESCSLRVAMWHYNDLKSHGLEPVIRLNGIILPDPDEDETFFWSSVTAAEEDKVWNEYLHSFTTKAALSIMEGDCLCDEEWELVSLEFIENIRKDISGEVPVTGEAGEAIIRDKDLAQLCKNHGFTVLPCGDQTIREDGTTNEWWIIFQTTEDEEEYFDEVYSEEEPEVEDESAEDPHFFEDPNTQEIGFLGKFVHSYVDTDGAMFFAMEGGESKGYTFNVDMEEGAWRKLCLHIEAHPENYSINLYKGYGEIFGVLTRLLPEMPFDKWDEDKWAFVHATGVEYLESNGDWVTEYEDDLAGFLRSIPFVG